MADFEDSNAPTWANNLDGHVNLRDAVRRTITFESPSEKGIKSYKLNDSTATLLVRPRGWHLLEKHLLVNGEPVSASLFDFALFFFHNAKEAVSRGTGPYFYLPKMESHLEARLWNDVFLRAQESIGLPAGTIRATVLIETILAAFEMDEILYELRQHSAGLNPHARPRHRDHGQGLPGRVRRPAHQDLPPPRDPRHGRHGRADPHQGRCRGERGGHGQGAGRQTARSSRRPRRHLGRSSRSRAGGEGDLRRAHAAAESDRPQARRRACHTGRSAAGAGRGDHGEGAAPERQRRDPLSRSVARRPRLRAALQPDGRRRYGRDLAHAALAMAAAQREARR